MKKLMVVVFRILLLTSLIAVVCLIFIRAFRVPVSDYAVEASVRRPLEQKLYGAFTVSEQGYHERLYHNHIVVKFVDPIPVRLLKASGEMISIEPQLTITRQTDRDIENMSALGIDEKILLKEIAVANQILRDPNVVHFAPLFSRSGSDLKHEREQAEDLSGEEMSDLNNYFHIIMENVSTADTIKDRLDSLQIVETWYFPPIPTNADIPPTTLDYQGRQSYLDPAPNGIDAQAAWNIPGGDGSGIKIIDIESAWNLYHEDISLPFFTDIFWGAEDEDHGTAVLGVLVAIDDGAGITGIAHQSRYGVVSVIRLSSFEFDPEPHYASVADSINIAASQLEPGDIILIEQHAPWAFPPGNVAFACTCNCEEFQYLPVEYWQAEYDAIRNATARGILVVEAAGNGGQDLDSHLFNGRFDRYVRDSGAIMVGASKVDNLGVVLLSTLGPACFTNYGSRVDVHAWGGNVWTLGYGSSKPGGISVNGDDDRQWYMSNFGGTSAASSIVAGAVASIQGTRVAEGTTPLGYLDMRNRLISTGTPYSGTKHIGPQPDLAAALSSLQADPIISYDECTIPAEHSPECGGAECRENRERFCWDECFLGIPGLFCEEKCLLQFLDEFECVNK